MFFANLSVAEFLALFGVASAVVVLLYLLDQNRRRQVVASLQFFRQAARPTLRRRSKIREPLSLLLQLAGLLLLLLAVAQPRFGSENQPVRDHVLVLDTSAWMAARTADGTLMDQARRTALAYLRTVPPGDRVLLLRAGTPTTPATSFETDRQAIEEAIRTTVPGAGALDVDRAIETADRIRAAHGGTPGEIVYVGSVRTAGAEAPSHDIANLRYLAVDESASLENRGLRRIGLRHSIDDPREWEVYVAVRNQGARTASVQVAAQFASSPAVYRELTLAGGAEQEFTFPLRSQAAGTLEVRLLPEDALPEDNRAAIELPPRAPVRIAVYTEQPDRLRPLLEASPMVETEYHQPGDNAPAAADMLILDRCSPSFTPQTDALWILPPAGSSPVPLGRELRHAEVTSWDRDHPVSAGLETRELAFDSARLLATGPGDTVLAATAGGPVAVARDTGSRKLVVLGFDPMAPGARYDLAAPLLFANTIRWMKPEVFRQWELTTGSPGAVSVPLQAPREAGDVRVAYEDGEQVPFTVDDEAIRFYAGRPGIVRVTAGSREIVYSLNLPAVADGRWTPPPEAARALPGVVERTSQASDIWYWLALAGSLCLWFEWLRYGRGRTVEARPAP